MDHDEFEATVADVLENLPAWVHDALHNIDVLVLDRADEHFEEDCEDLLGLYVGLPLPERGIDYAGELPDVIYIFREPHLALGLSGDALRNEIATTLVHEIAHYFGFDDERLHELGWG